MYRLIPLMLLKEHKDEDFQAKSKGMRISIDSSSDVSFGRDNLRESITLTFPEIAEEENLNKALKRISRSHVTFRSAEDGVFVTAGNTNPPSVNGTTMEKGSTCKMSEGDTICLCGGDGSFKYRLEKVPDEERKKRKREPSEEEQTAAVSKDSGTFKEWQQLCDEIAATSSYSDKTKIVAKFIKTFKGDLYLLIKLLLCWEDKRIFYVREKEFARIMESVLKSKGCNRHAIITDYKSGDMSATAKKFLIMSGKAKTKSTLTLKDVDDFLDNMNGLTRESEQIVLMRDFVSKCTGDDIKYMRKLINYELVLDISTCTVFDAMHPNAYDAYMAMNSNNFKLIVDQIRNHTFDEPAKKKQKGKEKDKIFLSVSEYDSRLKALEEKLSAAQTDNTELRKKLGKVEDISRKNLHMRGFALEELNAYQVCELLKEAKEAKLRLVERKEQLEDSVGKCSICLDGDANIFVEDCRHCCLCESCSKKGVKTCPICQVAITKTVQIFRS
eukprot:TRINITY_DN8711_c0_g1_i7.p1 TRINITY_DN8711_c0_g1~~TRINITY_DN8711_c0_g1_i7.p1  ORF type:complete len:499 (+),score=105.93 TRINITY_DN8711_c0_g1_i7:92-1588(+)